MIKIKRHGSFLEVDNDGFVAPVASSSLIQDDWKPIVDDVVSFYKRTFAENLHSVYIRGSVPKGEAIPNISDLDSFCITKNPNPVFVGKDEILAEFKAKYPFCEHTELVALGLDEINEDIPPRKRGIWEELIKTQSVCVYGEDLAQSIQPFTLKEMIGNAYFLKDTLKKLPGYFEEDKDSPEEIANSCVWICRRIIRSGFDLVMEEEQKFTRDLYLCWESFSKHYPEQKTAMFDILNLCLNPVTDINQINTALNQITPWLVLEIDKKLLS